MSLKRKHFVFNKICEVTFIHTSHLIQNSIFLHHNVRTITVVATFTYLAVKHQKRSLKSLFKCQQVESKHFQSSLRIYLGQIFNSSNALNSGLEGRQERPKQHYFTKSSEWQQTNEIKHTWKFKFHVAAIKPSCFYWQLNEVIKYHDILITDRIKCNNSIWMQEMDLDLAVTTGINNPSTHSNCGLSVVHIFSPFEKSIN